MSGKVRSLAVVGVLGLLAVAAKQREPERRKLPILSAATLPPAVRRERETIDCQIDWASAMLALAALADSAIEHYRGSFHNKTMYVPLGVATITLAACLRDAAWSVAPPRPRCDRCRRVRDRGDRHRLSHLQRREAARRVSPG